MSAAEKTAIAAPESRALGTDEYPLADFWELSTEQAQSVLLDAISASHAWHYERNRAYRHTVGARGVGREIGLHDLPRLLRPTAQTFKSYIEVLGTPFPQDRPQAFLNWMVDQLSVDLPRDRFSRFRSRYRSLEGLLQDIERIYADFGLEVSTSSGTSGRSTIMIRDQPGIDKTVEAFYLAFQRYLGMQADHRAIFVMPRETRIAMVRMASFSVKRVGLPDDRIHFTIPFPAYPDQVRIRAGRTLRSGWRGKVEEKLLRPFMGWMNDRYVMPRAIGGAIDLLRQAEASREKVLLFTGWAQLHAIALEIQATGETVCLAPGSLLGTGGGIKEHYPFSPAQIRRDLSTAVALSDGRPVPIRDTYGMSEANWAAMQCGHGNYHIPPWVYAVALDEQDRFHESPDSTGLLAFFDPFGGGRLFPAFFKTADRVRLINGAVTTGPTRVCPCGEAGAYISQDSIERVDRLDEAGCAAQV